MELSRKTIELSIEGLQDWLISIGNHKYERKALSESITNLSAQISTSIAELKVALKEVKDE